MTQKEAERQHRGLRALALLVVGVVLAAIVILAVGASLLWLFAQLLRAMSLGPNEG